MVNCECMEKQKLDGLYHLDPNDDVFFKAHVETTQNCVCHRYVSLKLLESMIVKSTSGDSRYPLINNDLNKVGVTGFPV